MKMGLLDVMDLDDRREIQSSNLLRDLPRMYTLAECSSKATCTHVDASRMDRLEGG